MTAIAAETIATALLNVAWRSTAAIALAFLATRVLRHLSASRRRDINLLSLVAVVGMTITTIGNALLSLRSAVPAGDLFRVVGNTTEVRVLLPAVFNPAPLWLLLILSVSLAGTLFALARVGHRLFRSARIVSRAETVRDAAFTEELARVAMQAGLLTAPRLRQSAAISTAAVYGFRQQTLLVSESWHRWSADRRAQILIHEICHLTNHDLPASLLGQCARALLWWNPALHFAVRELALLQEFVCDEQVVCAGTSAESYAETLLDLAKSSGSRSHEVVLAVAESAIPDRVERVLRVERTLAPVWHRWYARLAMLATVGLVSIPGFAARHDTSVEQVIDARRPANAAPNRIRLERDASGKFRVQPVFPKRTH